MTCVKKNVLERIDPSEIRHFFMLQNIFNIEVFLNWNKNYSRKLKVLETFSFST